MGASQLVGSDMGPPVTILVMLVLLVITAVAQCAMPGWAAFGGVKPPLLLSVVLYYALTRERWTMVACAILAGLLQDALSPVPLGYSTSCFCIIGFFASRFDTIVFIESAFTAAFFGALASCAFTLGVGTLLLRDGLLAAPLWWLIMRAIGCAALGAASAPIILRLGFWTDRMVGNVEKRRGHFSEEIRRA